MNKMRHLTRDAGPGIFSRSAPNISPQGNGERSLTSLPVETMTRDEVLIELARALPDYGGDLSGAVDKLYAWMIGETKAAEEYDPIDWDAPIEAVHEDGRVMMNEVVKGPDSEGDYYLRFHVPDEDGANIFTSIGRPWFEGHAPGWRIRNVGSK